MTSERSESCEPVVKEAAIHHSEELYRTIVENSHAGILIVDRNRCFLYVNNVFARMLGYSTEELIGREFTAILDDESGALVLDRYYRRQRGEEVPSRYTLVAVRKDGERRVLELSASLVEDSRFGISTVGQVLDITEQKKTEEALHRYAEEQAALYEITSAVSALLDPGELLSRTLDMVLPLFDASVGWVTLVGGASDPSPQLATWRGVRQAPLEAGLGACCDTCTMCRTSLKGDAGTNAPALVPHCASLQIEGKEGVDVSPYVAVPLVVEEDAIGVLHMSWPASRPYTQADASFLQAIGQQVGVALHNARLYQKALQVDRLRLLNKISAAAVSSLDLDVVLHQILQSTCHVIGADRGGIFVAGPEGKELTLSVILGEEMESLLGLRLALGQGVAGWVAQHKQSVFINGSPQDTQFRPVIDEATGETHAILCVPLLHQDQVKGVIEIVSRRPSTFTHEDLALIEAAGSIIANAIQNVRLYETVRGRAKELKVLNEIGLALAATLDPVEVARIAVSQTQRLFKPSISALLRVDNVKKSVWSLYGLVNGRPVEISTSLPPDHEIVQHVVEQGKAVLISDTRTSRWWPNEATAFTRQYLEQPVRSAMLVPVADPDGILGVLLVADTVPSIYTREEMKTLRAIGSTLSIALQNAYLYEAESRARAKMRGLTNRLAEVEEEERRRLARELHDRVGQDLTALDISLKIVQRQLPAVLEEPERVDELVARLEDASDLVQQTNRHVRNVMDDLRPPVLEDYGLLAALRWYATSYTARTNIPLAVHSPEPEPRFPPVVETVLFRIVQEALTNVARHARATQVTVRVESGKDVLRMIVADDGVGMNFDILSDPNDRQRWGLKTMIERAESIEALLWVESEPGEGTRVVVEVPYPTRSHQPLIPATEGYHDNYCLSGR